MKSSGVNCVLSELIVFSALVLSAPCLADEAQDLYKKGVERFKAEDYDGASRAFKAAYKLKPIWKLYYNIGQCEAAAKRYGTALEAFESFLAEGGDDVSPDRREEVLTEERRLRQMVGSVSVTAPDGALVFIDDVERGRAPIIGRLLETSGKQHEIWYVKGDRKSEPKLFKVNSGETIEISFEAQPEEAVGSPSATAPVAASSDSGAPRETQPSRVETEVPNRKTSTDAEDVKPPLFVGWTVAGIGAAAIVAGSVMGGLALGTKKDLDGSDSCIDKSCTNEQSTAVAGMRQRSLAADILLFSGAAAAVTGIVLLSVHAVRSRHEHSESKKVSWGPVLSPEYAGMSLTGRF